VEVLKLLLNAEAVEVNANYQPGKNTMTVRAELGDLFLPLEGLIDKEAETARLKKELEKIESEIAKVEQKLANPNFTQKVPAKVLENTSSASPTGRQARPRESRAGRVAFHAWHRRYGCIWNPSFDS
jgi:valyl-tRNA synthetase